MATPASVVDLDTKLASIQSGIKHFVEKHEHSGQVVQARLTALEQLAVGGPGGLNPGSFNKSVGEMIVESEGFAALVKGAARTGKIAVGSLHKNITGTPGGPLVPPTFLPGPIPPGLRPLTVRDLLSVNRTASNLVQYTLESGFTNLAAPQAGEGVAKPQSDLTFTLKNAPVQTIAHWMAASRQVLDDAPSLEDYINSRLLYGLKLVEENQLVNGTGTGFDLLGLLTSATPYSGATSATFIDVLGNAIEQVAASGFTADAIVLSLSDAWRLYQSKNSFGSYLLSDALNSPNPRVWGIPTVISQVLASGTFLCGAFKQSCAVWDRNDASIEISREHSDFFTRNMVAILCEERLALTVFRPLALVKGSVPTGS